MRQFLALPLVCVIALAGDPAPLIDAPPAGLDPFYRKHVDAEGIPIVGSDKVADGALLEAREIVTRMLAGRDDIARELAACRIRIAVMAATEQTLDVPEHRDLQSVFPSTDWNRRARGLGATLERPACSAAEENLLGLPGDRYRGENILVHEFAHTILTIALPRIDAAFSGRLAEAHRRAIERGLWNGTYAATDVDEYWAEGVQSWFDTNREASPADGIHNEINRRTELIAYDPELARLIGEVFRGNGWRYPGPPAAAAPGSEKK